MTAHCRSCGTALGVPFCDLGVQPLANSYPAPDDPPAAEPRFPLNAVACPNCWLVQLDHVADAAGIFTDYAYFSSFSTSWVAHARRFCAMAIQRFALTSKNLVVEVASNDGYLLRHFVAAGIPCLGVEPAANVAAAAMAAGVPTEVRFFGHAAAADLLRDRGPASLVVANNVLAHVPDLHDFVSGLALLAGARGVVSIEAPHLPALVAGLQFDTIYHEHFSYFSLSAMERVLNAHGLRVFDVERLPTHGGSLRVLASADAPRGTSAAVAALRTAEAALGVNSEAFYRGFMPRVRAVLDGFRGHLALGRRIAAYGAAAKGNTFLNACGVGATDILAVADKNPAKQGRLLPGSRIPIVTPAALLALDAEDILILPWNLAPEIAAELRAQGSRARLLRAVPQLADVAP